MLAPYLCGLSCHLIDSLSVFDWLAEVVTFPTTEERSHLALLTNDRSGDRRYGKAFLNPSLPKDLASTRIVEEIDCPRVGVRFPDGPVSKMTL